MTEFSFPEHSTELLKPQDGRVLIGVTDGVETNLITVGWGFLGYMESTCLHCHDKAQQIHARFFQKQRRILGQFHVSKVAGGSGFL